MKVSIKPERISIFLIGLLVIGAVLSYGQSLSSWQYKQKIFINTSYSGANTNQALWDFPLLVRLNASNFNFSEAQIDGKDIRFSTQEGELLDLEIERWDNGSELAEIWVKTKSILAQNYGQYIYMYWGSIGAAGISNSENVFKPDYNFYSVWHLDDDPEGNLANTIQDRTSRGLDGDPIGFGIGALTEGMVGKGLQFDGSQYIDVPGNFPQSNQPRSLSVWAKSDTAEAIQFMGGWGVASNNNSFGLMQYTGINWWFFGWGTGDMDSRIGVDTQWHYHVASYDGATVKYYLDGQLIRSEIIGLNSFSYNFKIGARVDNGLKWKGILDEMRVYNTTKSDDWIKLEYHNQKAGSKILIFGKKESTQLENFGNWAYQSLIVLNTMPDGANVSTPQEKFPVLIRLNQQNFNFAQAKPDGSDLRLTDLNETPLNFEIERWEANRQLAEVWVNMPEVRGNGKTELLMLWGNPDAGSLSSGSGVFSPENRFGSVWHLSETGSTGVASFKDASTNKLHGTGTGLNSENRVDGNIGAAQNYSGGTQYIEILGSETGVLNFRERGFFTLSAWVRPRFQTSITKDILFKGFSNYALNMPAGVNWGCFEYLSEQGWENIESPSSNEERWYYVAGVREGENLMLYVNGVKAVTPINLKSKSNVRNELQKMFIGNNLNGTAQWEGILDEIRVVREARTPDWIKLSFENQKANQTLVQFNALGQNSVPSIGYQLANIIPASQIQQQNNGEGKVQVDFKLVEKNSNPARLRSFSFSLDGGQNWKVVESDWGVLPENWGDTEYSSSPQFSSAPVHSFIVNSQSLPDFEASHQQNVRFRFKATDGEISAFCETETFSIDNAFPLVDINKYVTSNRSPRISGKSDEKLLFLSVSVAGALYTAQTYSDFTWEIPAGTITPLDLGIYDVEVTAIDIYGNQFNQLKKRALTITEEAAEISIDFLATQNPSPRITGTVSDGAARIRVQVNNLDYTATYIGNNNWEIPEGTIAPLPEGIYDIVATAGSGPNAGNDGTVNELIIDRTPPVISYQDVITNLSQPEIKGSVNEDIDSISIHIGDTDYPGRYTGGGEWRLDSGSLSLPVEGTNRLIITAWDLAGNMGLDSSGFLTLDFTEPYPINFSPNKVKTTNLPLFQISFSENTFKGEGEIILRDTSNLTPDKTLGLESVSGWGSKTLSFSFPDSLQLNTEYILELNSGSFKDEAGNHAIDSLFPLDWSFVTLDPDDAYISSITSNVPNGVYNKGKTLRLMLNFSEDVLLSGGNLIVTLETGEKDAEILISNIDSFSQVTFDYTVQEGDYAEELNVKSLELSASASLVNSKERPVLLDIGQNENLSAFVKIKIDGLPLDVTILKPENNQEVSDAAISYKLNKKILKGNVTWTRISPPSEGFPAVDTQTIELPAEHLTVGLHENVNLSPSIDWGKVYNMEFNLFDDAGNSLRLPLIQVKIGTEVDAISISPSTAEMKVGESTRFTVNNISDNSDIKDGVSWTAMGPGIINSEGWLTATAIGYIKLIAQVSNIKDTVIVKVGEGDFRITEGGDDTLQISDRMQLRIPSTGGLSSGIIHAMVMDSLMYSTQFTSVGVGVIFDSAQIDGMQIAYNVEGQSGASLYQLVDPEKKNWARLPASLVDHWLLYTLDGETLGSYILGWDLIPPTVEVSTTDTIIEGNPIFIQYKVNDNIVNPRIRLNVCKGGMREKFMDTLHHENGVARQYELPGSFVSLNGLFGYVEVFDGSNMVYSDTLSPLVLNSKVVSNPIIREYNTYKMTSFPMRHSVSNVNELIMDEWGENDRTNWRVFVYDSGFVEVTKNSPIEPGQAYWYKTQNFTPALSFSPATAAAFPISSPFRRPMHYGWNTFSNPYLFPIALADIQQANGGYPNIVYAYNSSWVPLTPADSIAPWEGYLMWNGKKENMFLTELTVKPVFLASAIAKQTSSNISNGINIWIQQENGNKAGVITAHPTGENRKMIDNIAMPISPNNELNIFFKSKSKASLIRERKNLGNSGNIWDISIEAAKKISKYHLHLNNAYAIPDGFLAVVLDPENSKVLTLGKGDSKFGMKSEKSSTQLKLAIGTAEYIEGITEDFHKQNLKFALSQNFPNPFLRKTRIQYTIPYEKRGEIPVLFKLYNIKGKLIFEANLGKKSFGSYTYELNINNPNRMDIHPGTYIYQLHAGGQKTLSKKLIFLGNF